MATDLILLRQKRSSVKLLRHRTQIKTLPRIIVIVIVVAVAASKLLVSDAFFNQRGVQRGHSKSIVSSFSDVAFLSNRNIGSSSSAERAHGVVRAKLPLCASVKSSNKSARKRKQKQIRKQKQKHSQSSEALNDKQSLGRSLSKDELYQHLNAQVSYGKQSPVGPRSRKRGIVHRNSNGTESIADESNDKIREQQYFLRQLNSCPTLVLNANYLPLGYMPLSLWSWQDAVKAVFKGSVTVVDVYPDITVRASHIQVPLPSVIALNDYISKKQTKPAFTRRNVFLRDEYICQYCNNRFHTADLTLDHVNPKSMGGQLTWDNTVTCCKKCNGRKGSTPLSKIGDKGMKLNRHPRCPTEMELAAISARMVPKRVHPTWKPYLGIQERPTASPKYRNGKKGDEEFIDDRYFEE